MIDQTMSDVTRSIREGTYAGLAAGACMLIAEIVAAAFVGRTPIEALRMFASIWLGPEALAAVPTATACTIGVIGHFYVSAMNGLVYGIYSSALTLRTRSSYTRQAAVGPIFGVMLWLIYSQIFARGYFPWLLELPQRPQLVIHALCYGLPLGVIYAAAERRATAAITAPVHKGRRGHLPRARVL